MHLRTVTILLGFVLLAGTLAYNTRPAYADHITCEAFLDGSQEVPSVDTAGDGFASMTFDEASNEISWDIEFSGLSGPATGAHFHGPAAEGVNADVQVSIGDVSGLSSPMEGSAVFTDDQASDLLDGMMYINIHTAANPGGEIRGQVECTELEEELETATLVLGDEEYEIEYMIHGGTLDELIGDPEMETITALITADEDGELTILLPREIVDSVENGEDADYFVYVDEVWDYADDDFGEDVRTLTIPFEAGTEQIDFLATFVVPEFGTIAAIVLAVAIVGIIVATARYGKFSFLSKT